MSAHVCIVANKEPVPQEKEKIGKQYCRDSFLVVYALHPNLLLKILDFIVFI